MRNSVCANTSPNITPSGTRTSPSQSGWGSAANGGLTWALVDFDRKEIRLKKTKNGLARTIPMNASVLTAFQTIKGKD